MPDVAAGVAPDAPAGGSFAGSYFDGHLAITPSFSTWNVPSGCEPALQHDFRVGLEGVGHDARVVGANDLAVVLHVEAILERVALPRGLTLHEAVKLQVLPVPGGRIRHHLVDVFVVFGALAERRVQQPAERQHEHDARQANLRGFVTHR